jgi:transcriptional regulator with XRE-family HTH domain
VSLPTTAQARALATVVGDRLRRARVAANVNQLTLATRLGVQAPYVSMVEGGKESISPAQVARWCALLGVDPASVYPSFPCPQCGHEGIHWAALVGARK